MRYIFVLLIGLGLALNVAAAKLTAKFYRVAKKGQGTIIGHVTFKDTKEGLLIMPKLHGLAPGLHGFHIHVKPNCGQMGMAANGHWDPANTGKHLGPYRYGHRGDLPALYFNKKGQAVHPELAPHVFVKNLYGHSIMIHEDGDNYSDTPKKLGGGGRRIACAVIERHK